MRGIWWLTEKGMRRCAGMQDRRTRGPGDFVRYIVLLLMSFAPDETLACFGALQLSGRGAPSTSSAAFLALKTRRSYAGPGVFGISKPGAFESSLQDEP